MSPDTPSSPPRVPRPADEIPRLSELELEGERVLVRLDLDLPMGSEGVASPGDALAPSLDTVRQLMNARAHVVVLGHLGNPGGKRDDRWSLESIGTQLSELTGADVFLPDDCLSDAAKKVIGDLRDGQLCLLENLDFHEGERRNDEAFARRLASYGSVYVNDAPRASRERLASVCALPGLMRQSALGPAFGGEVEALGAFFERAGGSFSGVVSHANLAGFIELIEQLLPKTKVLCVGGGAGNTLLAASGTTLSGAAVETELFARARTLLERARELGMNLVLPVDLGAKTLEHFESALAGVPAVFVLGALEGRDEWRTNAARLGDATARLVNTASERGSFTLVVGDEATSLVRQGGLELEKERGFVCRGGDSSLDLLLGKSLPGLEALRSANRVKR